MATAILWTLTDYSYSLNNNPKVDNIHAEESEPSVTLICDIDGDIYLTHRVNISSTKFEFYDEWGDRIKNIVAWMPLPAPYQVEE